MGRRIVELFMLSIVLLFLGIFTIGCDDPAAVVRYICFGDSATYGQVGSGATAYPHRLQQLLFDTETTCSHCDREIQNCCTANRAQLGEKSCNSLGRLESDLNYFTNITSILYWEGGNDVIDYVCNQTTGVNRALDRDPSSEEIRHIEEDIVDGCVQNAVNLIRTLKPNIIIYLGTYYNVPPNLPFFDYTDASGNPIGLTQAQANIANKYIHVFNMRIYELAYNLGIPVAPVGSNDDMGRYICDSLDFTVNYFDAMHANNIGNCCIAKIWYTSITGKTEVDPCTP